MIVVLVLSVGVAMAYVQSVKPTVLTFSAVRVGMLTLQVPDAWRQSPATGLDGFPAAQRYTDPNRPSRQLVVIATQTAEPQRIGEVLNSFARVLIGGDGESKTITARRLSPFRTQQVAGLKLVASQIQPDRMTVHTLATLTRDNRQWFAIYLVDTIDRDFKNMEHLGANDKLFNTILGRARIEPDPRVDRDASPDASASPEPETTDAPE